MKVLKPDRPPGWDRIGLLQFLEDLWSNSVATFANKPEARRLCSIDDLMVEIGEDWKGGSPTVETLVPLMMFFRAHSAFRSSAALGMGGATAEGMAVLRLSLEFAGYAALVGQKPNLAMLWFDRDVDETKSRDVRRSFTHGAIREALISYDSSLGSVYHHLYERLIQFGAHPNEKAVTANLALDVQKEQARVDQVYLQGDGIQLDHWLRTANQVGICILKAFGFVHLARYELLKVVDRISAIAQGL
jgi:hypothetical protein